MPHITSSTEVTSDGDSVEISEDSNSVVKQMADEANHQEEKNEPTLGQEPEPEVEGNVESPPSAKRKDCRLADLGSIMIPETWTPSKEFELCTTLYLDFKDIKDDMAAKLSNAIASHANLDKFSISGDTPKLTNASWSTFQKQ